MATIPCPQQYSHDAHFWISAIAGGSPGPCPQIGLICPGVER